MGWTNTNREWRLLAAKITDLSFELGIFTDNDEQFVFYPEGDRFIRPQDSLSMSKLTDVDFESKPNPFQDASIFPAIGTSPDLTRLYYGLRTNGFGQSGIKVTKRICSEIVAVEEVDEVLKAAFPRGFKYSGECWIAFTYLEEVEVNPVQLAREFIEFIAGLR